MLAGRQAGNNHVIHSFPNILSRASPSRIFHNQRSNTDDIFAFANAPRMEFVGVCGFTAHILMKG